MNNNLESGGGVENRRHADQGGKPCSFNLIDTEPPVGLTTKVNRPLGVKQCEAIHETTRCAGVATGPPGSFQNLELSGGVDGHARIRRDGTGRINPAVGLLDGAKVTHGRSCVIPLIAPTQAGIKSGPLDSFISFNQRYVLRLMVWTFLLGFAWATITWLARVTHGQTNVVARGTNNTVTVGAFVAQFLTNNPHTFVSNQMAYPTTNTVLHSDFEPVVVKTNGRWRITFKP